MSGKEHFFIKKILVDQRTTLEDGISGQPKIIQNR
jgi:hypothetical protein